VADRGYVLADLVSSCLDFAGFPTSVLDDPNDVITDDSWWHLINWRARSALRCSIYIRSKCAICWCNIGKTYIRWSAIADLDLTATAF